MLNFVDKAIAYLATGVDTAVTTLSLQTGKGALFGDFTKGQTAVVRIQEPLTGAYELVLVTARTSDDLTVTRGFAGTTPQAFATTAIVSLVANKSVFETLTGRRNRLINGCFRLWEYGTTFSSPATQTMVANRWKVITGGTPGTFTISQVAAAMGTFEEDGPPLFFLRWNQTIAGSGATLTLNQFIEDVRTLAGKQVTVSLIGKCAAASVAVGIFVEQQFGSGGSPSATVTQATQNVTLTTTLKKHRVTFTLPSVAGKTRGNNSDDFVRVALQMPGSATFDVEISQVQLEYGPLASAFELRSLGEEMTLARRYYFKTFPFTTAPANSTGLDSSLGYTAPVAGAGRKGSVSIFYPVPMRATPTLTFYNIGNNNNKWYNITQSLDSGTPVTLGATLRGVIVANDQVAGDAVGDNIALHMTASAEL